MTEEQQTKPQLPIGTLIRGFWAHLVVRRKRQLGWLLVLTIVTSFAEILSLGAMLPFLGILTVPDRVLSYPTIQPFLRWAGIQTASDLLLPITLVFIVAALCAGGMRLLLLYLSTRLSFAIGADFSFDIYRRTLYQPYAVHVSRNSSEVISGVTNKVQAVIYFFLIPLLLLISSAVILLAILGTLLSIDPAMSAAAFLGFGTIYGVVILATRKRLAVNSERAAKEYTQVVKVLQEGLGGIRDILIDGSQEEYCNSYRNADLPLRRAQAGSIFIGGSPRFVAEALGMAFIAILAYAMARESGSTAQAVTTLGVLALAAQRMLPVLQQSYLSMVQIRSNKDSLSDALELLNQPIDSEIHGASVVELPFTQAIRIRGLGFCYRPGGREVLRNLDLDVPKGSRTGFIGATGNGKSTLLDIIMGLLPATDGQVLIDDTPLRASTQRAWQRRIAHVPQTIFLSDGSVMENIAFGVPANKIDVARVHQAALQAQIADHIESLPDGYDTRVGERGVRLSGGQRQRIGIARALYKQAEVIILDEATSALDNDTERAVMDVIEGLSADLTILIIAHRLSTLRHCDQVVELGNGGILRQGSYLQMIGDVEGAQASALSIEPQTPLAGSSRSGTK